MTTTLKTAHTPGPWKAITTGYNRVDIRTDVPMNSRAIGEVYRDGSEPTGLANARLIAAAPEVKDELHDLCNAVELMLEKRDFTPQGINAVRCRIESSRAAIAKATG